MGEGGGGASTKTNSPTGGRPTAADGGRELEKTKKSPMAARKVGGMEEVWRCVRRREERERGREGERERTALLFFKGRPRTHSPQPS